MSKFKTVIDMLIAMHSKEINELQTENEKLKEQVYILKQKPTWLCSECSNQWESRNLSTEQDGE
jgi:hypothetical protein